MSVFWMFHLGVALMALPRLMRHKRDPIAAAAWWLAILFLPVAGVLLYLLAGREPRSGSFPVRVAARGRSLEGLIACACGTSRRERGRIRLLHDGSNAFSALIAALQRARRSISISYYIICDDRIGRTVTDILVRRARAGVAVRVIYDAYGSRCLKRGFLDRLRREGVDIRPFAPFRFPWFTPSALRRSHRKVVIVDGRCALLGGINLARYYLDGGAQGCWRDEHLLIEGEAVADLQRLFREDWLRVGGADFLPESMAEPVRGRASVQIAWASGGVSRTCLADAFVSAVLRAERRVRIASPYFLPPPALLQALRCAVESGVRVEVMIPAASDSRLLDLVSESYVDDLLAAGVELYRYRKGFLHAKYLVVDDRAAAVGTANMDYRSLELNEEVAAFLYDKGSVRELAAVFDRDRSHCERIQAGQWHPNGWRRCAGELLRLAAPLL